MKKLLFGLFVVSTFLNAGSLHMDVVKDVLTLVDKTTTTLTPAQLKQMIDEDKEEFYLLDIREKDQLLHGEIFHYNLVKITRGYLEFKIEREIADKNMKIIVYCCTGKRSKLAVRSLRELGYQNVYSLEGGLKNWVESGMPLDTVYGEMILKPE